MATPVNATAFAVSRETLDTRTIPESYIFLRDVGTIPFEAVYGDPAAFAELARPDFPVGHIPVAGRTVTAGVGANLSAPSPE